MSFDSRWCEVTKKPQKKSVHRRKSRRQQEARERIGITSSVVLTFTLAFGVSSWLAATPQKTSSVILANDTTKEAFEGDLTPLEMATSQIPVSQQSPTLKTEPTGSSVQDAPLPLEETLPKINPDSQSIQEEDISPSKGI